MLNPDIPFGEEETKRWLQSLGNRDVVRVGDVDIVFDDDDAGDWWKWQ